MVRAVRDLHRAGCIARQHRTGGGKDWRRRHVGLEERYSVLIDDGRAVAAHGAREGLQAGFHDPLGQHFRPHAPRHVLQHVEAADAARR